MTNPKAGLSRRDRTFVTQCSSVGRLAEMKNRQQREAVAGS
jgi:hypothetical protein